MERKGICPNKGLCSLANTEKVQVILDDELPFECKCGEPLEEVKEEPIKPPPPPIKKIILAIVIAAVLGGGGFGIYKMLSGDKMPSIVTITPENKTLTVGETLKLAATTDPESAGKNIQWKWASGDENIATVSSRGLVTGIKAGSATITVTDEENGKVSASTTITVTDPPPPGTTDVQVESVSLDSPTLDIEVKKTAMLTATVFPGSAANRDVTWSSSDETVAKVDNGVVTALKEGKAVVIAKSVADNSIFAECTVTVKKTGGNGGGGGDDEIIYPFGRYEGKSVNGRPEGQGAMYYTCRVQIAKHGRNTYYAEKGDIFVGTWGNGDIVNGNLYDGNNNQKAAILAGKRPNPYNLSNDRCEP